MLSLLAARWGADVVTDGRADRELIGRRVFSDSDELSWLEAQVHPLVRKELTGWIDGLPSATEFAVAEVPLLFEGEMADRFDVTVAVVTRDRIRRERAEARRQPGLEGREARQLDQAEKARRADHVIANDGTTAELEARLADLLARLREHRP